MTAIGTIKTSLSAATNSAAFATYFSAIVQVAQKGGSIVVLPAIIGTLIFAQPAQARFANGTPEAADFFDFERAKTFWVEVTTGEAFDAAYAECETSNAYKRWDSYWLGNLQAKLDDLTDETDLDLVKHCHDLNRAYDVWTDGYRGILNMMKQATTLNPHGPVGAPWNEWPEQICKAQIKIIPGRGEYNENIFTGQCNDWPDWRLPEQVKQYDTLLTNQVIRKGAKDDQSRQIIAEYLDNHGDTISKADRDALGSILKQLN